MLTVSPLIPSCAKWWAAAQSMRRRPLPRRWGGSKPRRWPCQRTGRRWPTWTSHGSTAFNRNGLEYIVLDMDSSVSPTHGDQEGTAWNGHFDCTCYHPNFLFNQFGMLERCALRRGNVHSADGWQDVLAHSFLSGPRRKFRQMHQHPAG